jgi:hypothetical protein
MSIKVKASALRLPDVPDLPVALDVPRAARLLGISTDAAYDVIARDAWPSPVVRVGRSIRIPTLPLLSQLGISLDDAANRLADDDPAA